jgi:hypothetical protein
MSIKQTVLKMQRDVDQLKATLEAEDHGFKGPCIVPYIDGKPDQTAVDAYIKKWNIGPADLIVIMPEPCIDTEGLDGEIPHD